MNFSDSARKPRSDIEGLRALAVLSVLVNHAFPTVLAGGFAGVDIFFVISGYLIGKHLLQDIEAGRLSFSGFYAKRARRIFPALALVLISVWLAGWMVFSAPEFATLGKHIAAATVFSNNFLLWSESGYFDTAAIDKPLLHLWSLGIEEQFYLIVPALLWIGTKGSLGSVRWVVRLGVLSLVATILLSALDYSASFYLLHTRFWELGTGVILGQVELRLNANAQNPDRMQSASRSDIREVLLGAVAIVFSAVLILGADHAEWARRDLMMRNGGLALAIVMAITVVFVADRYTGAEGWKRFRSRWLAYRERLLTASSIAGITLICVSLAALSSTNWPGAQTLLPVVGSALLIAAKPAALFNRLLSWRPLVFVGGISYPLYLWHWPAMLIWRLLSPDANGFVRLVPLVASFVLAWLTKILLEDPVRSGHLGLIVFRRPPLWPVVSGLIVAGLLGISVVVATGVPSRFPPGLRAVAEWSETNPDVNWRVGECYFYLNSAQDFSRECTPLRRPGVPLILLWGDSHAAHLYPGMVNLQTASTFDIAQWTSAGCPPTVKPLVGEGTNCPRRRETAMRKLTVLRPDTIVLGAAWERYLARGRSQDAISSAVRDTIHQLSDLGFKRIVVFGPGPLWTTTLPIDLFRFMAKNRSDEIPDRLGRVPDSLWRLDTAMAAQTAAESVRYVSVLKYFCSDAGCMTIGDRTSSRPDLLYRDQDHLTVTGSRVLIEYAKPRLWLDVP